MKFVQMRMIGICTKILINYLPEDALSVLFGVGLAADVNSFG